MLPGPRHGSILIADNDLGVSTVLREVLLRAGFETVETVADGLAASARLEAGGIDVLVCDIDMPKLDGEALLRRLDGWDQPPPVVVVSAFLDDLVQRDLARSKALFSTLQKPFSLASFTAVVTAAMESAQHRASTRAGLAIGAPGGAIASGEPSTEDSASEGVASDGPLFERPPPKNSSERA